MVDGQPSIKLNIWDFGGQEIMHATHQFFLTKRSLPRKFADKHGLNFPLLADPDKVAVKAYDVDGPLGFGVRRGTYLIGKDGRIQDSVLADLRIGAHEAFVANASRSGAGKT